MAQTDQLEALRAAMKPLVADALAELLTALPPTPQNAAQQQEQQPQSAA